jgi:hypothetical protein
MYSCWQRIKVFFFIPVLYIQILSPLNWRVYTQCTGLSQAQFSNLHLNN